MTNREKLNSMTDDEFAEWLCKQMWSDYDADDVINVVRFNGVRNFLKTEYTAYGSDTNVGSEEREDGEKDDR